MTTPPANSRRQAAVHLLPLSGRGAEAAPTAHSADAELRKSEERYRAFTELSAHWYWEQDEEYRFIYMSPGVEKRLGIPVKTILGKHRDELAVFESEQARQEHLKALAEHRPFTDVLIGQPRGDGKIVYARISGEPRFSDDGSFAGYRGIGRDVTAQYEAEQALRLSEERFRHLVELSSDWYWEQDEQFRYTELPGVFERTGVELRNVLGKTRWELPGVLLTDAEWAVHKATLDAHLPFYDFVVRRKHPDGRTRHISLSGRPLYDASGKFCGYRGTGKDITQSVNAERALRASADRFRDLTELSSDWYWEQDENFRFVLMSGNESARTGRDKDETIGKTRWELNNILLTEDEWKAHRQVLDAHEPFRDFEYKLRKPNGSILHLSISGRPIFDDEGNFKGYRGIARDVSDRVTSAERIQYLAYHDGLTNLPNRVMFNDLLHRAIAQARRQSKSIAVLFIDLDRFKSINDTLGHASGDELLKVVARRIQGSVRASDVVARLGGDEFVVLLDDIREHKKVATVVRKILSSLGQPLELLGQEFRMTASIGVSLYPDEASDEHALMKNADTAMYRAKEDGRNTFRFFSGEMDTQTFERAALESSLRRGIEKNEFRVHYQAKIDARTGKICGMEALVRWQHPELGMVPPSRFIPVAEETGLIIPLGKWILREACRQNRQWQKDGLPCLRVAVNLSARQFADKGLVKDVRAILAETNLPASFLELEITESMVMHDLPKALDILSALKRLGVWLAMDDFGTGYSSLSSVKRFPIDVIKVDKSFIRDIPSDADDKILTETIIRMAKSLKLTVVAEGVETKEQVDFLQQHACDEYQGFYFSKPVSAEEFTTQWSERLAP